MRLLAENMHSVCFIQSQNEIHALSHYIFQLHLPFVACSLHATTVNLMLYNVSTRKP